MGLAEVLQAQSNALGALLDSNPWDLLGPENQGPDKSLDNDDAYMEYVNSEVASINS